MSMTMLGFLPDEFPDVFPVEAGWFPPPALPPGCALAQDAQSNAVETVAATEAKACSLFCFMVEFFLVGWFGPRLTCDRLQ
jgi:hypothetical protein